MAEQYPNSRPLSIEAVNDELRLMTEAEKDNQELDPKTLDCLRRGRDLQEEFDGTTGEEIDPYKLGIRIHSLNSAWPNHGRAVRVSGWLSPDDFGFVPQTAEVLNAALGEGRITDNFGPIPKHLVSGWLGETHGFTGHAEETIRDGKFGQRAVVSLLFSRRLATAVQPVGLMAKRALPEATVTLRAGLDAVTMDFETGSPELAKLTSERYFPTAAQQLAELDKQYLLSPTQKLLHLRDHPITDPEPHYVTEKERASLAMYANDVVKIVDVHVPYYVDLADGAMLYRPDNSVMGALIGERGGQVRVLGITVGPKQAKPDVNTVADVKGELEYRLIVNLLGDTKNTDQLFAEISLGDVVNIQSVREMAPGNLLYKRGLLTDVTHVRRVPTA